MASITDLLKALENPNQSSKLENTKETWSRIGNKDDFAELGMSRSELDDFLTEWMGENDYNNLV